LKLLDVVVSARGHKNIGWIGKEIKYQNYIAKGKDTKNFRAEERRQTKDDGRRMMSKIRNKK